MAKTFPLIVYINFVLLPKACSLMWAQFPAKKGGHVGDGMLYMYSSPSILQPSILRPPLIIRPLDLVLKGNFLC